MTYTRKIKEANLIQKYLNVELVIGTATKSGKRESRVRNIFSPRTRKKHHQGTGENIGHTCNVKNHNDHP